MSAVRIGINGFGRVGRLVLRNCVERSNISVVTQINDANMDVDYLLYLMKYDTIHGTFQGSIEKADGGIRLNNQHTIKVTNIKDPAQIPWGKTGADYICESTGVFTTKAKAEGHLLGGAKKAIISAPAKDECPMIVMGVNHNTYNSEMKVVSNSSCIT
jgi:glyceraldehyde 3-phosphate dehydrogenase